MSTTAQRSRRPRPATTSASQVFPRPDIAHDFSANALTVLAKRYLIKDASGKPVEAPEDLFWRVATSIAQADAAYGASEQEVYDLACRFYALMVSRRWEPNSPTLMNAGRPLGQLSACFVLPVADELSNNADGIYDTLRSMALVHQSGGGTGFSFSRIRPSGSMVRSTTGAASGPVSFMELYNASTEVVKQGGTRRGANMGILRVDHPDILMFIACKEDLSKITNFNISVAVTDKFMAAVKAGTAYDLVNPHTGEVVGQLDAREVFDRIVKNAWRTGEPGVFFIDRANQYNPVPHIGAYEATNPCGEQPLLPFDVCNLGSLNLGLYVDQDADPSLPWPQRVRWNAMREDIQLSTHFLDNVIDANKYPLPQITDLAKRIRRIGNGIMGFADMLVRLGVAYDSEEGLEVGLEVANFFHEECLTASERLAETRGTFPEWERSIWGPDATCARDAEGNRIRPMRALRNCNVNTVAPTGTISIFAGCSSGLEPFFAVAFMRNQAGVQMPDVNGDFVAIAKKEGWFSDALMAKIASTGSVEHAEVPAKWQAVFATANRIAPAWHVRMQAVWQQHTDSAISKTTNFANAATVEDVRTIYELAFELGCKGVTVYRDGSRDGQVLSTGATQSPVQQQAQADQLATLAAALREAEKRAEALAQELAASGSHNRVTRGRPKKLRGETHEVDSPLGSMFVTINADEKGNPFEVFTVLGKAGSAAMADAEAMGRLISLALRSGIPITAIHRQLRGISSDKAVGYGPNKVLSVPDGIAIAIERAMAEREGVQEELPLAAAPVQFIQHVDTDVHLESCPDCKGSLIFEEGCRKCADKVGCGWGKCG